MDKPRTPGATWLFLTSVLLLSPLPAMAAPYELFARTHLMAWCIVPFDAKKRGPEERAAMLEKLGFQHFAYDYRSEHLPQFDAEIAACKRHGGGVAGSRRDTQR